MIKTLLILRHAHSSEKQPGNSDKHRELSREGVNGAVKIGTFIKKQGIGIDLITASTATRAIATATIVSNGIGYNPNLIAQAEELYIASVKSMVEFIHELGEEYNSVVLIGHNPHLSYLSEFLCKTELGALPPGGLAIIQFNQLRWEQLEKASGELVHFTSPELLE